MQFSPGDRNLALLKYLLLFLFVGIQGLAYSQVTPPIDSLKADSLRIQGLKAQKPEDNINRQYDFNDLLRNILHPKKKADTLRKRSGITIVPNIAANPT